MGERFGVHRPIRRFWSWILATTSRCALICAVAVMPAWAVPLVADDDAVVAAIRTMYAAAATDDLAKFHSVAAVDFHSFDGGQRFTGDALIEFIRNRHAQGVVYVWTVTEPVVHVAGDTAWITYVKGLRHGCFRHEERDMARVRGAVEAGGALAHSVLPQHEGAVRAKPRHGGTQS